MATAKNLSINVKLKGAKKLSKSLKRVGKLADKAANALKKFKEAYDAFTEYKDVLEVNCEE